MSGRRVLMTVDAVGGVWRYAMDLAAGLAGSGMQIVFAGFGPRPGEAERREAEALGPLHWFDAPLDWMATSEDELAAVPGLIDSLARRAGVDLLHLNLPSQAAGLSTDRPVVVVSHSCVVTWFGAVRGTPVPADWEWQRGLTADGLARADAVVAPTHSHAAMVEAAYGMQVPVTVIENASRLNAETPEKEPFFFAAGRWWDAGKNGAVLDAASPSMPWPLVLAGPSLGPNGERLAFTHADHRGALSHAETMGLMRRAAVVISPSLYEPFGLAALEAARLGAALILSDIPTYRKLWDDAALFADPRDPAAFAAQANRLAGDPALRHTMAEAAAHRARRFTPAAQTKAVLGLYDRLSAESRPARAALPDAAE
ncbi:glycosyltransferase family 4 protein [Rhizobium sp. YIM 134829]|uniref:glycosyltransferase family 4 protein n=1 Tax=Rhizobium sp. YIM 134829 TaxID=3390453 RepID=UPI00397CD768